MKKVMKEIIIMLLLILAILLVLGIFFYDYIPMNKVVPKIEPYEAPDNIKKELEESINDTQNTMAPIVYEITDKDLNLYEKTKDYQKGKVNPFGNAITPTENNNDNITQNPDNNTSGNTNKNPTNTTGSDSEGSYLPKTGTK